LGLGYGALQVFLGKALGRFLYRIDPLGCLAKIVGVRLLKRMTRACTIKVYNRKFTIVNYASVWSITYDCN
jgi:hypothetical protein